MTYSTDVLLSQLENELLVHKAHTAGTAQRIFCVWPSITVVLFITLDTKLSLALYNEVTMAYTGLLAYMRQNFHLVSRASGLAKVFFCVYTLLFGKFVFDSFVGVI